MDSHDFQDFFSPFFVLLQNESETEEIPAIGQQWREFLSWKDQIKLEQGD